MSTATEVKETLYTSLSELGLSDLEKELYIVSLKLGPSPITRLADHMKISRPNIYRVIRGLEEHGLTTFSTNKKFARNFTVKSPSIVLEKLRQRKDKLTGATQGLASLMPDLLSKYRQGNLSSNIKVYEDKQGFLDVLAQTMDEAQGRIQFVAAADPFINFISWEEEVALINRRVKRGVHIDILLTPGGRTTDAYSKRDNQAELREARFIRGMDDFNCTFSISANKTTFWQPEAPLVIVIEDEFITNSMLSVFNLLWSYGDPLPNS